MTDRRRRLARGGEWAALVLLLLKGYRIRHRNWSCALGELDMVAERRGEIVFVEVKTRSSNLFGGAAAAVDAAKRRQLARVAAAYLGAFSLWERPTRFDVVAVQRRGQSWRWRLEHIPNAFRPDTGRVM